MSTSLRGVKLATKRKVVGAKLILMMNWEAARFQLRIAVLKLQEGTNNSREIKEECP